MAANFTNNTSTNNNNTLGERAADAITGSNTTNKGSHAAGADSVLGTHTGGTHNTQSGLGSHAAGADSVLGSGNHSSTHGSSHAAGLDNVLGTNTHGTAGNIHSSHAAGAEHVLGSTGASNTHGSHAAGSLASNTGGSSHAAGLDNVLGTNTHGNSGNIHSSHAAGAEYVLGGTAGSAHTTEPRHTDPVSRGPHSTHDSNLGTSHVPGTHGTTGGAHTHHDLHGSKHPSTTTGAHPTTHTNPLSSSTHSSSTHDSSTLGSSTHGSSINPTSSNTHSSTTHGDRDTNSALNPQPSHHTDGSPLTAALSNHGTTSHTHNNLPGSNHSEAYPEQRHAGSVGLGPNIGTGPTTSDKIGGLKDQLIGTVTGNAEKKQEGKDRRTGELHAREHLEHVNSREYKDQHDHDLMRASTVTADHAKTDNVDTMKAMGRIGRAHV